MRIADIDQLNIIYFGEMNLPAWERAMRAEMATAFEVIARAYLKTIQEIIMSEKTEREKSAALMMAAAAFSIEYKRFFDKWYSRYYTRLGGSNVESALQWRNEHSAQLATWLIDTTQRTPTANIVNRIRTQIRTEINAMCNLADFRALVDSGMPYKRWNTHLDGKERPSHADANGQTVPVEEPFIVGGYMMMFPLDGSLGAPAEQIVNCRCTMTGARTIN